MMLCGILLLLAGSLPQGWPSGLMRGGAHADEQDAVLQRAAELALGEREGAIIVMDAQTGRVRAIVNQHQAAAEAFAPGSTIKPFGALAALRAGIVSEDSRLLCRERYRRADFEINCSHPKEQPPFDPAQALAFSCNYFFGELGEKLSEEKFNRTLDSFGFGSRTGFGAEEAAGQLPRGTRQASNLLGERGELKVTPIQLLTAYAALLNGGHLYVPQHVSQTGFTPRERARLEIATEHRKILLAGMRGAVTRGTAEKSGLASLPLKIFGKTGTSTAAADGGRTQGWFIGLAAGAEQTETASPESMGLAVLVFIKRAHGADAAESSRFVFEEFARMGSRGEPEAGGRGDKEQVAASARLTKTPVRVHLVRENETRTIAFEDYVLGVVAAEGSIEDELDALKALAVASRTYALKNLRRHESEGYDFCTTTHCQRYVPATPEGVRSYISRAVAETSGEILRDRDERVVESYFSASCGGMTANIQTLWGAPPQSYLRGVRDEYCKEMPHSHWEDAIPAEKLSQALESDERSNKVGRIAEVRITKRDATGRAELIEITGDRRRRTLRGWDFKIIVGRVLGWNLLKSSRFEIRRAGSNFVFRGTGFGHGLGLCQEGAHVMAENGIGYTEILARYFPGTTISSEGQTSL